MYCIYYKNFVEFSNYKIIDNTKKVQNDSKHAILTKLIEYETR